MQLETETCFYVLFFQEEIEEEKIGQFTCKFPVLMLCPETAKAYRKTYVTSCSSETQHWLISD